MSHLKEDKEIETYIKQVLSNYTLPYSDDEKKQIIQAYHHLKIHASKSSLSFNQLLSNKTFLIIIAATVSVILLIYLINTLLPGKHTDDHSFKENHTNSHHPITYQDSATSRTSSSLSTVSSHTQSNNTSIQKEHKKENASSSTSNTISISSTLSTIQPSNTINNDYNRIQTTRKNDNNRLQTNPSTKDTVNTVNNIPKKKKKKRRNIDTNTSEDILPVLEPIKSHTNNTNTEKEEE